MAIQNIFLSPIEKPKLDFSMPSTKQLDSIKTKQY